MFVGQNLRSFVNRENHHDLLVLSDLIVAGKVMPAIDRVYPLRDVPQAIRHLEHGNARGKVAIAVATDNDHRTDATTDA